MADFNEEIEQLQSQSLIQLEQEIAAKTVKPLNEDEVLKKYQEQLAQLRADSSKKAEANLLEVDIYKKEERIVLDFKDNGIGYDKNIFSDPSVLFELGIRKSKEYGYGIGLYHIKELVQQNKGEVYIDSDFENGFRIVVELLDEDKL